MAFFKHVTSPIVKAKIFYLWTSWGYILEILLFPWSYHNKWKPYLHNTQLACSHHAYKAIASTDFHLIDHFEFYVYTVGKDIHLTWNEISVNIHTDVLLIELYYKQQNDPSTVLPLSVYQVFESTTHFFEHLYEVLTFKKIIWPNTKGPLFKNLGNSSIECWMKCYMLPTGTSIIAASKSS